MELQVGILGADYKNDSKEIVLRYFTIPSLFLIIFFYFNKFIFKVPRSQC